MKSGSHKQQPTTHGPSMCQAVDVTGWLGGIGLWRFLLGCVEVRGTKGTLTIENVLFGVCFSVAS